MIYELALVAKPESSEDQVKSLTDLVTTVVTDFKGEVLLTDDWGKLRFAQPSKSGGVAGRYLYMILKSNDEGTGRELQRRFGINEDVLRHMTIKLGEDRNQEAILKAYKCPYSKTSNGSHADEGDDKEGSKERRRFSKGKSCWFTIKDIKADWKDPKTFGWLINEFGKISPARVSGISRKHQRFADSAIKQARNIGVASYISNRFAAE
ncbi:MAG: 30S ribosomal protein S18 [Bacteriovoracaceae bacterium]|nr:30S ribosomal protein S18 [Bacteriovoracaceae bacterium]